jgi:hypothetical protein
MTNNTQLQAAAAIKRVTGKQFYCWHQGYSDTSTGSTVKAGRIEKFKCFNCQAKGK